MNKKGFSIIEILLVTFIIAVLIALGFISYRTFEKRIELSTSADQVLITLQLAADRTIASKGDTVYGIHFASSSYTIFSTTTYDALDPDNEVYNLPSSVEVYSVGLNGGGVDVVFDRLTGATANYGEVVLQSLSDVSNFQTIKVSASGQVGYAGSISPADSRIIDSRHVHLDLGWSIQGASEMIITFSDSPDPDVQEIINMADYFDGGQTEFSWTGTTDVNGENQTLQVYTHSLDAFDTELSIIRDGRLVNKAFGISIDGKDIVSYTAGGTASVGFFGGTLTEI